MTTLDELCGVVASLGLPWANTAFDERDDDAQPPYVVIHKAGGTTYGANDATWCHITEYDIELYTTRRDYDLERTVSDALDEAGIYWSDGGTWEIQTEGLVETVYTVTVREN